MLHSILNVKRENKEGGRRVLGEPPSPAALGQGRLRRPLGALSHQPRPGRSVGASRGRSPRQGRLRAPGEAQLAVRARPAQSELSPAGSPTCTPSPARPLASPSAAPLAPGRAGAPQAEQRRGRGPALSSSSPVQLPAALRGAGAAAGTAPCPGRQRAGESRAGEGRGRQRRGGQGRAALRPRGRAAFPARPARLGDAGLRVIPAYICALHSLLISWGKKNSNVLARGKYLTSTRGEWFQVQLFKPKKFPHNQEEMVDVLLFKFTWLVWEFSLNHHNLLFNFPKLFIAVIITEYSELKWTHRDHQTQVLTLQRTP